MRSVLRVAAVWSLMVGTAFAASKEGVTLPDSVTVEGKSLVLNGMGVREATVFNVNVYVAGLYLEAKSSSPEEIIASEQTKRLDLVFVRDVDKDDITEAWSKGFKKNKADVVKLKAEIAQLNGWMSDVSKKDVISFAYVPGTGTTVTVKGQVKGTIPGAEFGRGLFGIWFGPEPPNGGLKKGLLGK